MPKNKSAVKKSSAGTKKKEKPTKVSTVAKSDLAVAASDATAAAQKQKPLSRGPGKEKIKTTDSPRPEKPKPQHYWEAVGRRKTSVARVRLFTKGEKEVMVNGKPYKEYFKVFDLQQAAVEPLIRMKNIDKFGITAKVSGGGIRGQAEAIRHGIARALVEFNPDFKKRLKRAGLIKRDPRVKERKKFGLKGARRAPQWAKR